VKEKVRTPARADRRRCLNKTGVQEDAGGRKRVKKPREKKKGSNAGRFRGIEVSAMGGAIRLGKGNKREGGELQVGAATVDRGS